MNEVQSDSSQFAERILDALSQSVEELPDAKADAETTTSGDPSGNRTSGKTFAGGPRIAPGRGLEWRRGDQTENKR